MLAQGVLDFHQYEADSSRHGLTSLAGLPVSFDLVKASGLGPAFPLYARAAGSQGWLNVLMVLTVVLLNLAAGQMPSGSFRANATRWALLILAFDLSAAMKRLALGKDWRDAHMKALRFPLIGLRGRVISHARPLIVRLGAGA